MGSLPSIDFSPFEKGSTAARRTVVDAVRKACTEIGFLCVSGHGVEREVIDAMRRALIETFAQPDEVKARHRVRPGNYRGYIPIGFFTPNSSGYAPDQYEGYKLHAEVAPDDPIREAYPFYGPNVWPETLPGMKVAVRAYWRQVDRFADNLLRALAFAIELDEEFFLPHFRTPRTSMTLLHYPTMATDEDGFGIHPHKDSSAFTILYPDPIGGLMVRSREGQWIEAAAPEGAFVINIGDVMEHWTGGHFVSTPHKVVNRTGKERYSFPYFATPRYDTVVEPVVECIEGYERPPVVMGTWHQEIIRSNWPDAKPISGAFDPGKID